eukprot:COSAG02_NODE_2646_length_8338_cov_5.543634_1_plen_201_part_00
MHKFVSVSLFTGTSSTGICKHVLFNICTAVWGEEDRVWKNVRFQSDSFPVRLMLRMLESVAGICEVGPSREIMIQHCVHSVLPRYSNRSIATVPVVSVLCTLEFRTCVSVCVLANTFWCCMHVRRPRNHIVMASRAPTIHSNISRPRAPRAGSTGGAGAPKRAAARGMHRAGPPLLGPSVRPCYGLESTDAELYMQRPSE